MLIGGANSNPVAGINLTSAELARIFTTSTGTITIGDPSQTGNITLSTATPATTAGASTAVVQSSSGAGQIILDDNSGSGTALNGNGGAVSLTAGTGGIVEQGTNTTGIADIGGSASSVTLTSAGAIGTSSQPIQFNATNLSANSSANNSNQFLRALSPVTVSSLNAGSGTITLQGGTFQLGAANAISSSSAVSLANVAGVTLDLHGFNDTIYSLAGGGTSGGNVALGSGTLTIGGSATTTYSGIISGTGSLAVQGGDTLTLGGTNTFAGGTTIHGATLLISSDSNLGTAPATPTTNITLNGGTLESTGNSVSLNANRNISLTGGGTLDSNTAGQTLTIGGTADGRRRSRWRAAA